MLKKEIDRKSRSKTKSLISEPEDLRTYIGTLKQVHSATISASSLNAIALKGAGMALGWRSSAGLSLHGSYARRVGTNPNPITTEVNRGADQDGTLRLNRVWLTASQAF